MGRGAGFASRYDGRGYSSVREYSIERLTPIRRQPGSRVVPRVSKLILVPDWDEDFNFLEV